MLFEVMEMADALCYPLYLARFQDKTLEPDFAAAVRGLVCMRLTA